MKVLHVPYTFYPDAVGGTEIYVEALARAQQAAGMEPVIAAPGDHADAYTAGGLPVRRFPVSQRISDVREMYGDGDAAAAEAFAEILGSERPDLVHVHAFTRGVSLRLVRAAKRAGKPVIFSYHTPTVSCQRGTLLKWGTDVCDGLLDVKTCAECTLQGCGLSRMSSAIVSAMPCVVGNIAANSGASGGVWTALRMKELVELRHAAFHSLMNEVDHVIALAEWVKELLENNRVPSEKITVSRQGLCGSSVILNALPRSTRPDDSLRIIFLGRLHPTKGVGLLIEALRRLPDACVQFDIFGIAQGEGGGEYCRNLRTMAAGDVRISFNDPIPAGEVVDRIRGYDLLAVPSQWLETGPMVALEAFAAGVPVVGSDLGGISETVSDGIDGLLVWPFDSAAAWAEAIRKIVSERSLLPRLRSGIKPPRLMTVCAAEMTEVYRGLPRAVACV